MDIREIYSLYKKNHKVTTDTRSELKDSIFFALKGDNFNANRFASKALDKGADFAVVDEELYQINDKVILVDDVLTCLQDLARYHRQVLGIPIIALTGSNGKTTTKELVYSVLKEKFNCVATKGNLNNHIGVPLTLLSMKPGVEIGVVEMGANHHGEINLLCEIILPDYGYITNFGKVHLEGFGSLQGVVKAKTELYDFLRKHDKIAFVNNKDVIQVEQSKEMRKFTFGDLHSDCPIEFINANPFVVVKFAQMKVLSNLIGKYNYSNIATAVAIGKYFKISDESIQRGIEKYTPSNNRSQILKKDTNKIILDAYNANPNSMEAAIENLLQLSDEKKIVILGDMFEIGEHSLQEHQIIADLLISSDVDICILIGEIFYSTKKTESRIKYFKYFDEFKKEISNIKIENATILIKASRGMALEKVVDLI